MKKIILIVFVLTFVNLNFGYSQSDKVVSYLRLVALGKADEVKKSLPDLMAEYPDDPGVMLLHAVVIEDAFKAIEIYEKIVNNYPESQWADDAYWRIVQFHAVLGDTTKALKELNIYRKRYPTSEFLIAATDVVRSACIVGRKHSTTKTPDNKKSIELSEKEKKETPSKSIAKDLEDNSKATYGLQVGIYSTEEAAKAEMKRFHQQRLRTTILPKVIDGIKMYAVIIGNYSTKEAAEEAKIIVAGQCNCTPLIFKK